MERLFTLMKVAAVLLYLAALVSLLQQSWQAYRPLLLMIGGGLMVAHLLEFAVVQRRLNARPASTGGHFLHTLLFGFLYWWPLLKRGGNPPG